MAMRGRSSIGLAMAMAVVVVVGAATIALTPSPASACSFTPPTLGLQGYALSGEGIRGPGLVAGARMSIGGIGYFTIDGEVFPNCSGDYDFVPRPPVTVVVEFQTLSGPRSTTVIAEVSKARIPREEADDALPDQFHIEVDILIPGDATSVRVQADSLRVEQEITGAVATTVPIAPGGSAAAGAAPVDGSPTFTG